MKINRVNIGEAIKNHIDETTKNYSHFGRLIGKSRQNVDKQIFQKQSIDTSLLAQICEVLNYNFFTLYYTGSENVLKNDDKMKVRATIELELTEDDIKKLGLKDKIKRQLK